MLKGLRQEAQHNGTEVSKAQYTMHVNKLQYSSNFLPMLAKRSPEVSGEFVVSASFFTDGRGSNRAAWTLPSITFCSTLAGLTVFSGNEKNLIHGQIIEKST